MSGESAMNCDQNRVTNFQGLSRRFLALLFVLAVFATRSRKFAI